MAKSGSITVPAIVFSFSRSLRLESARYCKPPARLREADIEPVEVETIGAIENRVVIEQAMAAVPSRGKVS
jgi:hypothetical protein